MKPWEKYQETSSGTTESGPWSKYAEKPEEKGFIRRAAEAVIDSPALPIAGGVTGAILGAPSGPAAIGTAALGGAAGEAWRQNIARSMGMDAPATPGEAVKKIGVEGITQGAGEALGLGLGQVGKLAMKTGLGKTIAGGIKKTAGDAFQLVTKLKPREAETLFKHPSALKPSTMKAAREEWKAAAKEIGLPVDQTTPAYIKALKNPETAFDTFEKITAGEPVSALEAQIAKKVVKIRLRPTAVNERNRELVAQYDKMADAFTERLSQESPRMAAANKGYAIGKAGEKFRSLFPRNQNDSPAWIRSSLVPSLMLGGGLMKGDPVDGALLGGGAILGSSPLVIGSLIAAAGGLRPFAPAIRRTLSGSLAELANEKFKRK